jgi:MoxR-like ATPase
MSDLVARALAPLRALLDAHVVGHDATKRALLLALACGEHVYLEGPPGSAKTRMAEILARGSELRFFAYQLHRDTRLHELAGDVVLVRRPLPDGGEQIQQRIEPGGILTAEVCLLDDISRAPGEALNVLLRVLNERRFGERRLPLRCAIATGNPTDDAYANEPLDPAQLDRFALQLRVEGLLGSGDLGAARALLERFASADPADPAALAPVLPHARFAEIDAVIAAVRLPVPVREALLALLRALVEEHGCSDQNSLLSDRTFLVKALHLLRGCAALAGRASVALEDLDVLGWMTTFRVPPEVHEKIPALVARARTGR